MFNGLVFGELVSSNLLVHSAVKVGIRNALPIENYGNPVTTIGFVSVETDETAS